MSKQAVSVHSKDTASSGDLGGSKSLAKKPDSHDSPQQKPPKDEVFDEFDYSYIPDDLKDLICGPEAVGDDNLANFSTTDGISASAPGKLGHGGAPGKDPAKHRGLRRRRPGIEQEEGEEEEGSEEDEDYDYDEDEDWDWDQNDSLEDEEDSSLEYPSSDGFPLPGRDSDDDGSDEQDRKARRYLLGSHSFLELLDPGLEDALAPKEIVPESQVKEKHLEKKMYMDICKEAGVQPIRKFLQNMNKDAVDLNRYYLTSADIIAICKMMENNTTVKYLNLSGNAAGLEGGLAIAKMIENNYTLTHLKIAATGIQPAFKKICESVEVNITLESLDCSRNQLKDADMQWVGKFLKETSTLKELFLSRNHIRDQGAQFIGQGLLENQSLEFLDLAINELLGDKKMITLFQAVSNHPTMKSLALLNNTLRDPAGKGIWRVFNNNKDMEFLNISYNIFSNAGAKSIGGGFRKSLAMQEFIAGPNEWRQDGAATILLPLTNDKTSPEMKTLDFGWLFDVYNPFLKAEARVQKIRPDLNIIRGNAFGQEKAKGPDPKSLVIKHARVVCENFATPLEMLIDELRTEPKKMTHKDFKKFIKSCNLYKDKSLTDSFIHTFKASSFEVDCEGIIAAFDKEYPKKQVEKSKDGHETAESGEHGVDTKEMKRERDTSIHLMKW